MSDITVAFVQARMTSKRLPGKVLEEIDGRPMLEWVVRRALLADTVDKVIVLTSMNSDDVPIIRWCERFGVDYFAGSEQDVLGRFSAALNRLDHKPSRIIRLTADCPLLDPGIIDQCVRLLIDEPRVGYVATRMPSHRTFPIGLDVEVFRSELLADAENSSKHAYQREHVTPWFYDGGFDGEIRHLTSHSDHGKERWTVDTPEDLAFVRAIAKRLKTNDWEDVLEILRLEPELRELNAGIKQKTYKEAESHEV